MKKYGFVHPTKTGGTAVEKFFIKHYSDHIGGRGHREGAGFFLKRGRTPIIIIREPLDRFYSMFNYWKNGATAGKFQRRLDWDPVCKDIGSFVESMRTGDARLKRQLKHGFTFPDHFIPQAGRWIRPNHYDKTIIIRYVKNLDLPVRKLLNFLEIPDKGVSVPMDNVSKVDDDARKLTCDEELWVNERFGADFALWYSLNNEPDSFLKVI